MKVFLVCHPAKVHLPLQGGYQRGMFERHLKPVESPDDESYQVFSNMILLFVCVEA